MFEPAGNVDRHHNVLRFNWKARPRAGGEAAAGSALLVLGDHDRIRYDYQFDERLPACTARMSSISTTSNG